MVMNISQNAKSPRSKKEAQQQQQKAGKKRAMHESESEEDDEEDEIDLEMLKKLSKKMKPSDADQDSDDEDDEELDDENDEDVSDEDDDDDEEDDDDDEEEDDGDEEEDSEEEEQEKPVKNAKKTNPALPTPKSQIVKQTNGQPAPQKQETVMVNGNAVVINNLDRNVRKENLLKFVESKSGVKEVNCFISHKPSAMIITKNKQEAEKIMKACQSTLFLGNQLQVSTIASGMVANAKPIFERKNLHEIEPSKTILIYSLTSQVPLQAVKNLCPLAIECNQSKKGIFVGFANVKDSQESFLELAKMENIGGVNVFVKYVKNNGLSNVHTGKETRLMLFNMPHQITKDSVQELAPKASFVHYNPCAPGGWIVEFPTSKDCKEAGDRLLNYQTDGRTVRICYAMADMWDLRFDAKGNVQDAKLHFAKHFPDMCDFHIMSHNVKQKRLPAFMLTFKTREQWQRALEKALTFKSIQGVQLYLPNIGKAKGDFVKKLVPANAKQVQQPKMAQKKEEDDEEEDDDDDEDEEEAMDHDDDDDDEEEAMDQDDEDVKPVKHQKPSPGKGGNFRGGRGGGKFGGQHQRGGGGGRGGNFRGRGRGGSRGGNFRGRGK